VSTKRQFMKGSFDVQVGAHQSRATEVQFQQRRQLTIAVKYFSMSSNFKDNKPNNLKKGVRETPSPILVKQCAYTMSQLPTNPTILSGVYGEK